MVVVLGILIICTCGLPFIDAFLRGIADIIRALKGDKNEEDED